MQINILEVFLVWFCIYLGFFSLKNMENSKIRSSCRESWGISSPSKFILLISIHLRSSPCTTAGVWVSMYVRGLTYQKLCDLSYFHVLQKVEQLIDSIIALVKRRLETNNAWRKALALVRQKSNSWMKPKERSKGHWPMNDSFATMWAWMSTYTTMTPKCWLTVSRSSLIKLRNAQSHFATISRKQHRPIEKATKHAGLYGFSSLFVTNEDRIFRL